MNLFGVLKYKKMGEDFVRNSGLPYTIIRYLTIQFCLVSSMVVAYAVIIFTPGLVD